MTKQSLEKWFDQKCMRHICTTVVFENPAVSFAWKFFLSDRRLHLHAKNENQDLVLQAFS